MSLLEQIKNDLKISLKKGDYLSQKVLRLLIAEIQKKEKDKRYRLSKEGVNEKELEEKSRLTEEEVLEIVFREVKKRKEAIIEFQKGGREDLAETEKKELEFLEKYLPPQLSEEEIREEVRKIIQEKEEKNFGEIMSFLMSKYKGRIDGSLANRIVRSEIEKIEQ